MSSFYPLISSFQRLIEFDSSHQFNFILSLSKSSELDLSLLNNDIILTTTINTARIISRKVNDLYQADPTISQYQIFWNISNYPIKSEKLQNDSIQSVFKLMCKSVLEPITIEQEDFFLYLILFDSLGNTERDRGNMFNEFKSLLKSVDEAKCLLSSSFRTESLDYLSDHFIELLNNDVHKDIEKETMFEIIDLYLNNSKDDKEDEFDQIFSLLENSNENDIMMHFLLHLDMDILTDDMVQYITNHLDYEIINSEAPILISYLQKFFTEFCGPPKTIADFSYTGSLQTFTVPKKGKYEIRAVGASGSGGNTYNTSYTSVGGRGAEIVGKFDLDEGDVIDIVVGGQGRMTNANASDGASGGGGGGTFVFKRIKSITDSRYQFTKKDINYETLLVAAGGSGGEDSGREGRSSTGHDGEASNFKSPSNFTEYSTESANPNSCNETRLLGIKQFIEYDAKGSYYFRNNGYSYGGYGCGGSADDRFSYGGGWCQGSNSYQSTSWSLDADAVGTNGANNGDGHASINRCRKKQY